MYRFCMVTSFLIALGCNSSESSSTAASNQGTVHDSSASKNDEPLPAVVVKVRIVPLTTAQGLETSQVLTTWKYIGTKAIRLVDADITVYDANGNVLRSSTKKYSIYATSDSERGVAPGKTYITPKGTGFILMPGPPKAKKAEIRLTNVAESAGF